MIFKILLVMLISYLLGSISTGYFFSRIKHKDLRKLHPNYNIGATNTYHNIGKIYGILTGIIDLSKGSLAFLIGLKLLSNPDLALIFSLPVILGHNYPFYLEFHGGKGFATSLGLLIISLFYTRSWVMLIVLILLSIYGLLNSRRIKIVKPKRKLYRLTGFIIPLLYFFTDKSVILNITFIALIIFLTLDVLRILSRRFNHELFERLKSFVKPKEEYSMSTTTLFLISATLTLAFSQKEVAITAIIFFIVGDTVAEIFGKIYRDYKIGRKSLEGSLACFSSCIMIGTLLIAPLSISLFFVIKAAFFASLIELASQKIDDNLTMPIGTALLLSFL